MKFKTPRGVRLAISRKRKKIVDLCIQPHETATVNYMVVFKSAGHHTIKGIYLCVYCKNDYKNIIFTKNLYDKLV